jgi:Tfp pilus assembly protein FimT
MLIVIVLTSILVQMAITSASSTVYDQLRSVANVVSGELAYGRSLAVGNNTSYCFDIDPSGNRLVMHHTGADATLNTLPSSPFRSPGDPSNQAILALNNLPHMGLSVSLLGAQAVATSTQSVTTVEFNPYGNTTQAAQTVIWFTAGSGDSRRFYSVTVNPVTGLSAPGSYSSVAPAGLTVPSP